MPVVLTLPTEPPDGAPYVDALRVYKRLDAFSYDLLDELLLGPPQYVDPAGLLHDEYHITFYSTALDVESLPSNIYRVTTHWAQNMGVILELQTTSPVPSVNEVGVYRRRHGESLTVRLGTVPLGTTHYSDPDGQPGDEYHTTFIDSLALAESQPGPSVLADAGAGMVVVTGFFRDVRNQGVELAPGARDPLGPAPRLEIELVWDRRYVTPVVNGQTLARTHYDLQVQAGGVWSVPLVANDLILGLQSYYEFTFSDGRKYFKRVDSANGVAQNFALLADARPVELR